jgi:CubicO group peptidase (beta-lactamase class C family)
MKGDPGLVLDAQVGANSPGLQYQVRNANELLFEYSGGFADIRHQRPMDAFTTLNAYSMSKTFTAAAVLRLAQAGGLKLDDTIARYFAQLPYDRSIPFLCAGCILCNGTAISTKLSP